MQTQQSFLGSFASGLGGALAITALNEGVRRIAPLAPRIDKLGEQAIGRGLLRIGLFPASRAELHRLAFGGEILSNTLFFGAVARGRFPLLRSTFFGALAGLGAVALPPRLGLSRYHRGLRRQTKLMTIGYYAIAGLCAGLVGRLFLK